jgi:hypothetical protein
VGFCEILMGIDFAPNETSLLHWYFIEEKAKLREIGGHVSASGPREFGGFIPWDAQHCPCVNWTIAKCF